MEADAARSRYRYCFWQDDDPWGELPVYASGAAAADAIAARICERLRAMGYGSIAVTAGPCPVRRGTSRRGRLRSAARSG